MAAKTQAERLEEMKPGRVFRCRAGDYVIEDARPGPDEHSVLVSFAEVDEPQRFYIWEGEIIEVRH